MEPEVVGEHTDKEDSVDMDGDDVAHSPRVSQLAPAPVKKSWLGRPARVACCVCASLVFGGGVWLVRGPRAGQEYLAGYLLEQSLSVDNVFVFFLIFDYFRTPQELQGRVLTVGLALAALLRGAIIALGVEMVSRFRWLLLGMAGLLLASAWKLLMGSGGGGDDADLSGNLLVRLCRYCVPVTAVYDGKRFFTRLDGRIMATPLLLVLLVLELSDIVFAVDSIPAVLGITLDPFIVYSSNLFAILTLRAMYSLLAGLLPQLQLLEKAVALVLGFIGAKMIAGFFGLEIGTRATLAVVLGLLAGGVVASLASRPLTRWWWTVRRESKMRVTDDDPGDLELGTAASSKAAASSAAADHPSESATLLQSGRNGSAVSLSSIMGTPRQPHPHSNGSSSIRSVSPNGAVATFRKEATD